MNSQQAAAEKSAAAMTRSKRRSGFSAGKEGCVRETHQGFPAQFQ